MSQQQLLVKAQAISPEEKEVIRRIYANSSEAYSRTFLPLAIFNRDRVIVYLKDAKKDLDLITKVL